MVDLLAGLLRDKEASSWEGRGHGEQSCHLLLSAGVKTYIQRDFSTSCLSKL